MKYIFTLAFVFILGCASPKLDDCIRDELTNCINDVNINKCRELAQRICYREHKIERLK